MHKPIKGDHNLGRLEAAAAAAAARGRAQGGQLYALRKEPRSPARTPSPIPRSSPSASPSRKSPVKGTSVSGLGLQRASRVSETAKLRRPTAISRSLNKSPGFGSALDIEVPASIAVESARSSPKPVFDELVGRTATAFEVFAAPTNLGGPALDLDDRASAINSFFLN
eukprot:10397-Heterococcus_DN1.PRE.1